MRWAWIFIRPHWRRFLIANLVRITINILWAAAPLLTGLIITALQAGDTERAIWCLTLLVLTQISAPLIGYTRAFIESPLRDRIKREFSLLLLQHTIHLPLAWHESAGTGNKIQRIISGRDAFSDLMKLWYEPVMPLIATAITTIISLTTIHAPAFSLLFLLFIGSYLAISWISLKPFVRINDAVNIFFERVLGAAYEFASSIQVVKYLHLFDFVMRRTSTAEENQMQRLRKLYHFIWLRWMLLSLFAGVALFAGIGGYALWCMLQKSITLGTFVTIFYLSAYLWNQVEQLAEAQEAYIEKRSAFLRAVELLHITRENLDRQPAAPFPRAWRHLTLTDVTYGYRNAFTLKNISLTIRRGERIALVGHSGAGKSTLVKLLTKQVAAQKGTIAFDGIKIDQIPAAELLAHIAVVPQEVDLFNISIRENILIAARHPERLQEYLRMAHADEFVRELSHGSNTIIGERGVKLSGGQRQRIGIARALAMEPDIIIFDEATSSLDSESERAIQEATHEMFAGRTALIIAHRLSTVRQADRIIVFDQGRIAEIGTFRALLKKPRGIFAKLWKLQKLD